MTRLEEDLKRIFSDKGLSIAVAESCTGGMLAARITDVPGSSAYFLGGVVSYAYEAKENLLGVEHATLMAHGAVSEEVALQMAQGARRRFESSVAVSITGVAGPGGGTDEKPVGLTYIGLADDKSACVERYLWESDRAGNRMLSVDAALQLLIEWARSR